MTQRLGRYTLLEELAQGGMSRVFVAQKDGAERICVLKELLVELRTNEVASKRFYREAHIASFLDHPNIARLLDAGFEDDRFCLAVEHIAGADLESVLRTIPERRLSWELGVAIALFVLDGLAYAHDARDSEGKPLDVVHRDIAPRNVMIGFDGEVKLIDFGLARGRVDAFATEPGVIIGTLRYLSPEQARSGEVDRRSDLYSLGVVMHEMLTGQRLVQEKTPLGVLRAIMEATPPLMRTLNLSVPTGVEITVARALEKEPRDRWQSANEMREALLEVVGPSFARERLRELGALVRALFPESERRAADLVRLGRQRFASAYGAAHPSYSGGTLSEAQLRETIRLGDEDPTFALDSAQSLDAVTTPDMPKVERAEVVPAPIVEAPSRKPEPARLFEDPGVVGSDGDGDTIPIPLPLPDPAIPMPYVPEEQTLDGRFRAPSPMPFAPRVVGVVPRGPVGPQPAPLDEATAISHHPHPPEEVDKRLVVAAILAIFALLALLPLAIERCDSGPRSTPIGAGR